MRMSDSGLFSYVVVDEKGNILPCMCQKVFLFKFISNNSIHVFPFKNKYQSQQDLLVRFIESKSNRNKYFTSHHNIDILHIRQEANRSSVGPIPPQGRQQCGGHPAFPVD